jgi:hypothetical protein
VTSIKGGKGVVDKRCAAEARFFHCAAETKHPRIAA